MRPFLLGLIVLKAADVCAADHVSSPATLPANQSASSMDPLTADTMLPLPSSPPVPKCIVSVFKVIETKMNRTKIINVPLGASIRYNTLIIRPLSCAMQIYVGEHRNTTMHMEVLKLPYRVMTEPKLADIIPPTLEFNGLMSTISPTFAHPDYAIIPVECKTVACAVGG